MIATLCQRFGWTPPLAPEARYLSCLALMLAGLYLWVLPTGHTVALRNLLFFSWVGVTGWAVWRYRLPMRLPLAWAWAPYLCIALFSLLYAVDPLWSLGEIKKEVGYSLLILTLAASWVRNISSLERLVAWLVLGNLLLVGAVLYKVLVADPIWLSPLYWTLDGSLLNYGDGKTLYNGVGNLSTYLVTTLPLIGAYGLLGPARPLLRTAIGVLVALDMVTIFLSGNRMGLLVTAVEILFVGGYLLFSRTLQNPRKTTFFMSASIFLLIGMAAIVLRFRPPSADPRWPMWAWAINDILADPLHGGGFGRTVMVISDPEFRRNFYEHAHNMVINKGVQMGLPGIAAFLLLYGATVRSLWPRKEMSRVMRSYALATTTLCLGVFLKNMTDDFFVSHNAYLFWLLTGATLGALAGEREKQTA